MKKDISFPIEKHAIIEHDDQRIIDNIPGTMIAPSPLHGHGLFARKKIPAGTHLTYLSGQYLPVNAVKSMETPTKEWNAITQDIFLYRIVRTKYGFINHHTENNNCRLTFEYPILQLATIKDIVVGEELLLDYTEESLPDWYLEGHGKTYLGV